MLLLLLLLVVITRGAVVAASPRSLLRLTAVYPSLSYRATLWSPVLAAFTSLVQDTCNITFNIYHWSWHGHTDSGAVYRLLHLVLVSLQTLGDGHQHTVDVGVQRAGLLPVGAGKRELGDEGDGGEDL